jgi:outer membrane protein assembly factor BamB
MKTKRIFLSVILLFLIFSVTSQVTTRWRGPNANGIYNETGVLKQWPATGPAIAWHFDQLGEGYSSPAIANGLIYLSGSESGAGFIYALTPDGKLKWKAPYGTEFTESYPGSRSTPVIAGDLLYMFSGLGVVYCMSASNGELKWKKDLFGELDGKNITWGVTETLVVDGDKIYCTPGGKTHNFVAIDRMTGKIIWSSKGLGELSAYCTPTLVELPQRKIFVTHTADHILGIDASNGNLLWSYSHTNEWSVHPNAPIYNDGMIFCFSGYGKGSVMLKLSADGTSVTKEWTNEKLDSRIGGMVLVNGYLYGSGDKGREWRCIDWKTGEEKYASTAIGKGAVIYADGMLFCYSDRGELALVEASPSGFNVKSKTKVELGNKEHWAHPVINDDILFVRHGNTLIAYKIK